MAHIITNKAAVTRSRCRLAQWFVLPLVLVLGGCGAFKEYVVQPVGGLFDWDTEVELDFTVEADVNPDADNGDRPSPVVVRIYELSSVEAFESTGFRDLYFKDKEMLADSLLKGHKLKPLLPGTQRTDHFKLTKGSAYVGLFAEFSQYKDAKFRIVLPVDEYLTTRQRLVLSYKNMILIRD